MVKPETPREPESSCVPIRGYEKEREKAARSQVGEPVAGVWVWIERSNRGDVIADTRILERSWASLRRIPQVTH